MKANTEAIYREFPFVEKYVPKYQVTEARVSRVTDELLDQRSGRWSSEEPDVVYRWMFRGVTIKAKIFLFDRNGKFLARVGSKKLLGFWPITFVESIGEAILRLGSKKSAHYVVWHDMGYLDVNGELIVYKPPQGFTIRGWYEEQIVRAQRSVRDGLNVIDHEAVS